MGRSDYFAKGDWNFFCDFCGAKEKASNGEKTWNGYYVCRHHREKRNPQDFVRGVRDNQSVPWSRSEAPDTFVPIEYDRSFAEAFPAAEAIGKKLTKQISPPYVGGSLNAFALNAAPLNGPGAVTAANLEKISLSEATLLAPGKNFSEAVAVAESITLRLSALRSVNGASLNSFALG